MILVTGAAGKTGRAIVKAAAAAGLPVRCLVHRTAQVDDLLAAGAQEVVVGDLAQPADLQHGLRGAAAVYYICPNMHPDEIALGRQAIAAAQEAGVSRFVYHSVLHPQTEAMPHHWHKLRVEELLLGSGLDWTILQPAAYMQNVLAYLPAMRAEGVYRVPYAPSTRLGMVDLEDVAAAAARVLVDPAAVGATLELAGAEVLTQDQLAAHAAAVLGRPVHAEMLDRAQWAAAARRSGLSEYAMDTLLRMFVYYEQYGFWGSPLVLRQLLGREPATFSDFLRRHISA